MAFASHRFIVATRPPSVEYGADLRPTCAQGTSLGRRAKPRFWRWAGWEGCCGPIAGRLHDGTQRLPSARRRTKEVEPMVLDPAPEDDEFDAENG